MSPRNSPLAVGESIPSLQLIAPNGQVTMLDLPATERTLMYFMRTSTCPVCHSHLKHMENARVGDRALADHLTVIVPGTAPDALAVERRHPGLAGRIVASETAHEVVGLFVKAGLQQSGSFVVDGAGAVLWARTATVPLGSYNEVEALDALSSVSADG